MFARAEVEAASKRYIFCQEMRERSTISSSYSSSY
jgi:hypothetical protein